MVQIQAIFYSWQYEFTVCVIFTIFIAQDVTPTILSFNCLATLRQCDYVANSLLVKHDAMKKISQVTDQLGLILDR